MTTSPLSEGDWDSLEQEILQSAASIVVPVFLPYTEWSALPGFARQVYLITDHQLIAYHHQVIRDGILFPYQTRFDDVHWWAAGDLQNVLMMEFYHQSCVQLNRVRLTNECHCRYPMSEEGRRTYRQVVRQWLGEQFIRRKRDISKDLYKRLPQILWRTFMWRVLHPSPEYSIATIARRLHEDSALYQQIQAERRRVASAWNQPAP